MEDCNWNLILHFNVVSKANNEMWVTLGILVPILIYSYKFDDNFSLYFSIYVTVANVIETLTFKILN
jgi:hypothetical protein